MQRSVVAAVGLLFCLAGATGPVAAANLPTEIAAPPSLDPDGHTPPIFSPSRSPDDLPDPPGPGAVDGLQAELLAALTCLGEETRDVLGPDLPDGFQVDPKEGDYGRCVPEPDPGLDDDPDPGIRDGSGQTTLGIRVERPATTVPSPPPSDTNRPDGFRIAAGALHVPMLDPGLAVDPMLVLVGGASLLAAFALAVLYRRLTRDEILDHDLRGRMLEAVRSDPGIHARDLARRLDVDVKTVLYHGRILHEAGVIDIHRGGDRNAYFERGSHDPKAKELLLARRQDRKGEILEAVQRDPGRSMADLARRLDVHRSTIKHHVDDLVDRGLLTARRDGRTRRIELDEAILGLLAG